MNQMRTGSGDPPIPPPSLTDIKEAARRVRGVALWTHLVRSKVTRPGEPIRLKAECLQLSGT